MFKLNLKIALRNLLKYKGYTLINVLGLAVGLAGCLLIFVFTIYQLSFDKGYENEDRIYRITSVWDEPEGEFKSQGVPRPLAAAARQDIAQFEEVATIRVMGGIVKVPAAEGRAEHKSIEGIYYVEPQFFNIFKIKWLSGDPGVALKEPYHVALSKETADKFYGDWKNAVGKSLLLDGSREFKVTAVFNDFPQNSSFPFKLVMSYASYDMKDNKDWGSVSSNQECYVLLKQGVKAEELKQPLDNFVKKYYANPDKKRIEESHALQPLADIHHNDELGNFANKTVAKSQLLGLGVIGFFLLLTASINFINLATAQAVSRSKEVGVRKVMGSMRYQLIWQFLSETALVTIIALLLACILTELALPGMESLLGGDVNFTLFGHPEIYIFLGLLILIVSFFAGLYPALIVSGFSPALAIKNKISAANSGGIGLRKALVVIQFAITGVLVIGTLMVVKQMNYMRAKPLGFDATNIALVDVPSDSASQVRYNTLKTILAQQKGIKGMSFCFSAPSSGNNAESSFKFDNTKQKFQLNAKPADTSYLRTFGIALLAGRNIKASDTINEFLVNETMLKKLNIADPQQVLGKLISLHGHTGPIVGVVKDFNNQDLRSVISPVAIFSQKDRYNVLAVKMESAEISDVMKKIEAEVNKIFPEFVYSSYFFDENIKSYYETERVMGALFKVFSSVVIFISFIGLFGLISFVATQRTREIAIRRVLGASDFELVKMLNSSFLWMVLIANVVAWPVAYILVNKWLEGFVYRTSVSAWPFLLAMLLSVTITLITVSLRSYRAARANPIDALKYE